MLPRFLNEYPYTDFHELNLDWILRQMQALNITMESFVNVNTIKYADPIQWSIASQYEQNTLVQDNGLTFLSKKAVPTGINITNTDYWLQVADFTSLANTLKQSIAAADDGSSTTSTANRSEDELVWLNDYLYVVLRTINVGDAYIETGVNPNVAKITLEQYINSAASHMDIIKESIAIADDASSATSTANRSVGDLVWLNDHLYQVILPINAGDAYVDIGLSANIQQTTVEDLLKVIDTNISNAQTDITNIRSSIAAADEGSSTTATANRTEGELVWLNGVLYVVTANMNAGDTYTVGTNVQSTTIEQEILSLDSDISAIETLVEHNWDAVANVRDYGAVGDGVTDDTAAVNLAIADINAGNKKVLFFPCGTYLVTSFNTISKGCAILGQDVHNTVIKADSSRTDPVFTLDGFADGTMCNMSLKDVDPDNTAFFIVLYKGNFVSVHDMVINVSKFMVVGDPNVVNANAYYTQITRITGEAYNRFVTMRGCRSVTYITNCGVHSEYTHNNSRAIEIDNKQNQIYDTLVVESCIFQRYYNGLIMNVPAGVSTSNIWLTDTTFDGMMARTIVGNVYGNLYRLHCSNVWMAHNNSNTVSAVLIQSLGSGLAADLSFSNCQVPYCQAEVMNFQAVKGLRIVDCILPSYDQYGIIVDDTDFIQICSNKIGYNGANVGGTYTNGIVARRDAHMLIATNDFSGNTVGVAWTTVGTDACTYTKIIGNLEQNDSLTNEQRAFGFSRWFNASGSNPGLIKYWDGSSWQIPTGYTYYDTGTSQLKYWNGSTWVAVP